MKGHVDKIYQSGPGNSKLTWKKGKIWVSSTMGHKTEIWCLSNSELEAASQKLEDNRRKRMEDDCEERQEGIA